jgi:SAM-dependent methyltransferase
VTGGGAGQHDSFDVVLADRLLGHLDDPVAGLRHLAALAKPGGRVVVVNMLNAATTVNLGHGSEDRALAARVLAWRAERGTTSPWAAGVLPSLACLAGLEPVAVKCWTFACASLADTFPHTPLLEYGEHAQADGVISEADALRWRTQLESIDAAGEFAATITVRADVLRSAENARSV